MQPSDFTTPERCLVYDTNTQQFCWCSRNPHKHPRAGKRLTKISPYFDNEEQAVNWIQLHFINQEERTKANGGVNNVVPLFASLKPLYKK